MNYFIIPKYITLIPVTSYNMKQVGLLDFYRPGNRFAKLKLSLSLVVERLHKKYGSAILIRNDQKVNKIYERAQGTVEIITIVMSGVVVQATKRPV